MNNITIKRLPKNILTKKQIDGNKIREELLKIFSNDKYKMVPSWGRDTEFYEIYTAHKKNLFQRTTYKEISKVYFEKNFDYIYIDIQQDYFDSISESIISLCKGYKTQRMLITEVKKI